MQISQGATTSEGLNPNHADVETALQASWALVDVAARSLVELAEDVSAPQYRLLVLIDAGVTRGVDLAQDLEVHSSTIARMVERLVTKKLIDRSPDPHDRRANVLSLTPRGSELVQDVNEHRRRQLIDLLNHLEPGQIETVVTGFTLFTRAAEASGHGTPTSDRSCPEDPSQQ
ncbi:MarR family winged helix-turn-helix transcriptional regulator [Cutibacterium sp. V947]|uniref:MarR family winged helix-turn-helix transcriptional regulator n=1 Tax=unclassified Cutibacterium TaxID=2649671 RepID=UPI003EE253D6